MSFRSDVEKDPEKWSLALVQQFLYERGHVAALRTLEAESGVEFNDATLSSASELMMLVYAETERRLAQAPGSAQQRREERLLRLRPVPHPRDVSRTIPVAANPTCVVDLDGGLAAIGFANGEAAVVDWASGAVVAGPSRVASAGVLAVAPRPLTGDGSGGGGGDGASSGHLAVGSMDGTVAVVAWEKGSSPAVLSSTKAHGKYASTLAWLGRTTIASGGLDGSLSLSVLAEADGTAGGAGADAAAALLAAASLGDGGGGRAGEAAPHPQGPGLALTRTGRKACGTAVTAVTALPGPGRRLVAALRDSHLLWVYEVGEDGQPRELGTLNLNAQGDDHVSFTATHLAVSDAPDPSRERGEGPDDRPGGEGPDSGRGPPSGAPLGPLLAPPGSLLAVGTDTGRVLVLDASDGSHLRAFAGVATQRLSGGCPVSWASDRHIAVGGADGSVTIFALGDGRVAACVQAHRGQGVRALTSARAAPLGVRDAGPTSGSAEDDGCRRSPAEADNRPRSPARPPPTVAILSASFDKTVRVLGPAVAG